MTHHKSTRLLHAGRAEGDGPAPVNPPVVRTSTVLFDDMAALREAKRRRDAGERLMSYGRRGTPSAFALEDALCELEGGARARLLPSGLCAITVAFMAFLRPGDHVLIADCVYEPVRRVCRDFLAPFGIDFTFFPAGAVPPDTLLRPSTRMIYTECPGSLVYELSDLRATAALARRHGARLVVDNTWGSGYLYNPLALGADVSMLAATKYIVGHSDVMMGALVTTQQAWQPIATAADTLGAACSPDDCYLALRGLRTMPVRLAQHQRHALAVAQWLDEQPGVRQVFYPALPSHPRHDLWQRDFHGANGLVSIELDTDDATRADAFADALALFGIGSSWGGYESLVLPADMGKARTLQDWRGRGPVVRLHIGLEYPDDLIADLAQALARAMT